MGDLDTMLIAASAIFVIVLAVMKGILSAYKEPKKPKPSAPPKPTGIVTTAHKIIDDDAKAEQDKIKDTLEGADSGKGLADLINQRRRK